jgi:hypothetical protein
MSTSQASSSASNIQLIIDALADYAKVTGIDLSENPFAAVQLLPKPSFNYLRDERKPLKNIAMAIGD